jgi:two-component system sensor histidine kinase BaeS
MAVALVVALVVVSASRETSSLAASQRQQTADASASAAANAYRAAGGWAGADLATAQQVAQQSGGTVTIRDTEGRLITSAGMMQGSMGASGMGAGPGTVMGPNAASAPVRVAGRTVGTVVLRSPGSGLSRSEQRLRDRLVTSAIVGGALSVILALAAALLVSRRLTAPLGRLTRAARGLEAGEPGARAAAADAPGEIGELSRAFDRMAQTLDAQALQRHSLLAEIAHELRTPLTILRGNCEAMVDGVEEPTPGRLASLHDEVLRLERLVTDLETLSASEAAFVDLDLASIDVADVARETVSLLSGQAADAGVSLTTELTPAVVDGDRARLAQIFENLITNALKFTPARGEIAVRVARADGQAVIEIRDSGRGIPAGELPHVFERFWRGSDTTDTGGRGIGLAVVDELVRAHGGQISVSSEPGRGSVFTVRIPAR